MSGPLINVDKQKADDPHYRYKMPTLQTTRESGGNGVKTVFPNISSVCEAVYRPPQALLKHFSVTCGAQTTITKENKYFMMGEFSHEVLQEKTFDFIDRFVLCSRCRNPETVVKQQQVRGGSLVLDCASCGHQSLLVPGASTEKTIRELAGLLGKFTQPDTAKAIATSAGGSAAPASAPAGPGEGATAAAAARSKNMDLAVDSAKAGAGGPSDTVANPMALFHAAATEKGVTRMYIQKAMMVIKAEAGIPEPGVPRLIFRGATYKAWSQPGKPFIAPLRNVCFLFANLIANAANPSLVTTVIMEEVLYHLHAEKIAPRAPMLLKMLLDENIISGRDIIAFAANPAASGKATPITPEATATITAACATLVEWIKVGLAITDDADEPGGEASPADDAPAAKTGRAKKPKKKVSA